MPRTGVFRTLDDMQATPHPIDGIRSRPMMADATLAAVLFTLSLILGLTTQIDPGQRAIGGLGWSLIVAVNLALVLRRRSPVLALWLTTSTTLLYWILDYPDVAVGPSLMVMVYSVAAHVDRPRSLRHGMAASGSALFVALLGVLVPQEELPWFSVPINALLFATAWILGDNLRNRRAYLRELEQNADRMAQNRDLETRRALSEERTRIARELHDVVAHSMSVIVVQAGAARRLLDSRPDRAAEALRAIESTGRESLNEMRRILGVLRSDTDEAELTPAPSLADLGRLARQYEEAGLPVDISYQGARRSLPASIELSAYRIVQESLTNTLKHAGPAHAGVQLTFEPESFCVEIVDDGRGAASQPAPTGAGQGLLGMRERVEAFGGSLVTGPRAGGGFGVMARFPAEVHA